MGRLEDVMVRNTAYNDHCTSVIPHGVELLHSISHQGISHLLEHSRFPLPTQVLIENGADVNAEDTEENTVLAVAASHGHLQIVGVLCKLLLLSRILFME